MFTQHIYQAFTRGFNDLLLANIVGTIWFSVPLMTGLSMSISNLTVYCAEIFVVALLTQVFYCYRVAILTKSKCAVAIIIMVRDTAQEFAVFDYFLLWLGALLQLSIAQLGAAIATAMQTRAAMFLPNILRTKISLITIGVWFGQHRKPIPLFDNYVDTRSGEQALLAVTQQLRSSWYTTCVMNCIQSLRTIVTVH